ncbi:MAG TPA: hypothetical protein VIT42_10260 [Microlunatus sp.]
MVSTGQSPASRRYLWGLALALVTACVVALGEIDAQSGRMVDGQGRAWPFSVLVGPGAVERSAGWSEVLGAGGLIDDPLFRALLSWHLAVDLIFLLAYGCLLTGLVAVLYRSRVARRLGWGFVAVLVAVDLLENVCLIALIRTRTTSGWEPVLQVATSAKWGLLALVGAALLLRFVVPQRQPDPAGVTTADASPPEPVPPDPRAFAPRASVARILRALMHHRFSVAMIIPLIVLTMLSGSAILEQLPDVQRRWASDGAQGWLQALAAVLVLIGVAMLLEVLARFRTGWAERHQVDHALDQAPLAASPPDDRAEEAWLSPLLRRLGRDLRLIGTMIIEVFTDRRRLAARLRHLRSRHDALLALWLVGAAVPLVAALLAWWLLDAPVLALRLLVFCAVPVVVVVISWILRRAWQIRIDWYVPDAPPEFTALDVSAIRFTGHALALTALTVGGIGLIRSYLSVVALGPAITGVALGPAILFLVLGAAGIVLPWVISWALAAGAAETVPDPLSSVGTRAPARLFGRWVLLGVVLALFLLIAVLPGVFGHLGVSAVAIVSLTLLIGIPATAGLLIQERPTAEVFRILGFRRTPLVSVLVIAIVLAGLTVGGSTIHRVIDSSPADPPRRAPVTGLVQTWLNRSDACEVELNGQRVRPMIMVAAEGGGIRAAYWTVKGLAAIDRETEGCGAHSTLFSGGASGGSVGLTVARFSGTPEDPGTERAVDAVKAMAEPETLGQAVIGTFVRDPAYAATGVPLGTNGVAPARSWADRARLIELGWNDASVGHPWGTTDFLADPATLSPATGPLVLNSSSVASQCRTWVSQLDLEQPTPPVAGTTGEQRCDRRVGPGARTVDLFAAYGPVGGTGPNCLRSVTASTAALLTARFPFVTPGGVIGGCDTPNDDGSSFWPRTQLIDGGYIENTGLATITDLSAQWLAQVRTHNDDVVAGRTTEPLIIPFVVFLTNEQATTGRLTPPPALQSELLLPAVGYLQGSATLSRTDALLQRVSTTVRTRSICPPSNGGPIDCDATADAFPRRVIVVDRTAQPEVTAPLGWVLSEASMTGLNRAMQEQVTSSCSTAPTQPSCLRGYGTLGDLLGYLH